jgi:hypothetical protein
MHDFPDFPDFLRDFFPLDLRDRLPPRILRDLGTILLANFPTPLRNPLNTFPTNFSLPFTTDLTTPFFAILLYTIVLEKDVWIMQI